jgi:hypothetical protein
VRRDVQFVRSLQAPYRAVRELLRDRPAEALGGVRRSDAAVEVPLTATVRGTEVSRPVHIEVAGFDEPAGVSAGSHLLLRGDAVSRPGLFPHLECRIDAVPLGDERTALFLVATYKPPFGIVGGIADALALYRFGEASLERWFHSVGDRIEAATG